MKIKVKTFNVHTIRDNSVIKHNIAAPNPGAACEVADALYGGYSVATESGELTTWMLATVLNLKAMRVNK